ncbi:MAG: hypothetical protein KDB03_26860 [Planctomycetales bacterium]|nr:hypothetical protein [Planctomycetales bacterium]
MFLDTVVETCDALLVPLLFGFVKSMVCLLIAAAASILLRSQAAELRLRVWSIGIFSAPNFPNMNAATDTIGVQWRLIHDVSRRSRGIVLSLAVVSRGSLNEFCVPVANCSEPLMLHV